MSNIINEHHEVIILLDTQVRKYRTGTSQMTGCGTSGNVGIQLRPLCETDTLAKDLRYYRIVMYPPTSVRRVLKCRN